MGAALCRDQPGPGKSRVEQGDLTTCPAAFDGVQGGGGGGGEWRSWQPGSDGWRRRRCCCWLTASLAESLLKVVVVVVVGGEGVTEEIGIGGGGQRVVGGGGVCHQRSRRRKWSVGREAGIEAGKGGGGEQSVLGANEVWLAKCVAASAQQQPGHAPPVLCVVMIAALDASECFCTGLRDTSSAAFKGGASRETNSQLDESCVVRLPHSPDLVLVQQTTCGAHAHPYHWNRNLAVM